MEFVDSARCLMALTRDHENWVGDESCIRTIESIPLACGLTLRVAAAHVIVSPYRVIAAASDTKRRRGVATKTPAFAGYTKKVRIWYNDFMNKNLLYAEEIYKIQNEKRRRNLRRRFFCHIHILALSMVMRISPLPVAGEIRSLRPAPKISIFL